MLRLGIHGMVLGVERGIVLQPGSQAYAMVAQPAAADDERNHQREACRSAHRNDGALAVAESSRMVGGRAGRRWSWRWGILEPKIPQCRTNGCGRRGAILGVYASDHPLALGTFGWHRVATARSSDTRGVLDGAEDVHARVCRLSVPFLQSVDVYCLPVQHGFDHALRLTFTVGSSDELAGCSQAATLDARHLVVVLTDARVREDAPQAFEQRDGASHQLAVDLF